MALNKHFIVVVLVCMVLLLGVAPGVRADDVKVAGPLAAGTYSNGAGDHDWDLEYTSIYLWPYEEYQSNFLRASNFGFSLPEGATVCGIVSTWTKRTNLGPGWFRIYDAEVRIIEEDGDYGGEMMVSDQLWPEWPPKVKDYGWSTYTWGREWSAENINDVDFGMALKAYCHNLEDTDEWGAIVDSVTMTVYYTEEEEEPPGPISYQAVDLFWSAFFEGAAVAAVLLMVLGR